MDKKAEVDRIEREAVDVRLATVDLCREAGINESTWWRVRKNPDRLTLKTLDKLESAIRRKRKRDEAA